MKFLYHRLHDYHNTKDFDAVQRQGFLEEFIKLTSEFKERVDLDELSDKSARLKLLVNAYIMDRELKLDLLAYNDLFEKLMIVSIQGQMMYKEMFYSEGFPDETDLRKVVEKLEGKLVTLIGFGGPAIIPEEVQSHRETKFKKDLKLKK